MSIVKELSELVKPTQPVSFPLTNDIQDVIKEIYLCLANNTNAIGVAAIQLGLNYSIFGMYVNENIAICINPSWKPAKDGKNIVYSEGCLSFPNEKVKTKRTDKIIATAYNIEGNVIEMELSGIESICFQHETDHCNGIVMHERQLGSNGIKSRTKNDYLRSMQLNFN